MQTWGVEATGWSPALRKRVRRDSLLCARRPGYNPCTATTLRWAFDKDDPEVSLQLEQIQSWMNLWTGLSPRVEGQGESRVALAAHGHA